MIIQEIKGNSQLGSPDMNFVYLNGMFSDEQLYNQEVEEESKSNELN